MHRKGNVLSLPFALYFFLLVPWVATALLSGCGDSQGDKGGAHGAPGNVREVRLDIAGTGNRLTISDLDPFQYDGRGPGSVGTVTYQGDGIGAVLIPQENLNVNPLPMVPNFPDLPIRVDITPNEIRGTINFCTGEVSLFFDAIFQPVVFSLRPAGMSVVTDLTTGTSTGLFSEVTGRLMDYKGDLRLVGVAVVPETGDRMVDTMLNTPTDAVTEMESTFIFPDGMFECPDTTHGSPPNESYLIVSARGELSIGEFGPFAYDGKGSMGEGEYELTDGGWADVRFSKFVIPPLQIISGSDIVRIEIVTHELAGQANLCTGEVGLDFDATFTPYIGSNPMTSVSVVTRMTTETSTGLSHTAVGERLDRWGDGFLVGVAPVPETEDPVTNRLISLPSDAVAQLPMNLRFIGEKPACP